MRLVILESPFRGATEAEQKENVEYAREAMIDCLRRDESPLASHLLWPGILNDADAQERALGIAAGLAWGRVAEAIVVYCDRGFSVGMVAAIERAHVQERPVEYRRIKKALPEGSAVKVDHQPMPLDNE